MARPLDAIAYIVTRPRRVAVNELLIRPTDQEFRAGARGPRTSADSVRVRRRSSKGVLVSDQVSATVRGARPRADHATGPGSPRTALRREPPSGGCVSPFLATQRPSNRPLTRRAAIAASRNIGWSALAGRRRRFRLTFMPDGPAPWISPAFTT